MKGCFTVQENKDIKFDIKCEFQHELLSDGMNGIPESQRTLYVEVEHTNSIIKNLICTSKEVKSDYFKKLLSLAQVGLVGDKAQPALALESLKKLKEEILLTEGMRIKTSYMMGLGKWALLMSIASMLCFMIADYLELAYLKSYFIVFTGAQVGTWISFGARKFNISFEELCLFEKDMMDKSLRLVYIGIAAVLVLLMLNLNLIHINVCGLSSETLNERGDFVFFIGTVCGLVESSIGINLYEKANAFVRNIK